MKHEKQEVLNAFKGKECLYKEGKEIYQVTVSSFQIDDWGIKLTLKISNSKQAINDLGDLEYIEKPKELNQIFSFSGAWEITNLSNMILHVSYINGSLNANPTSVERFKKGEIDLRKVWLT